MSRYEYMRLSPTVTKDGTVVKYKGRNFDYKTYRGALLDVLGSEGWELVTITSTIESYLQDVTHRQTDIVAMVQTSNMIYHFKREILREPFEGASVSYMEKINELIG